MAYGPKFSKTDFQGGKNILASEHLQFIEGGATMDASEFSEGTVGVGKLVARKSGGDKFVPFKEDDASDYQDVGVTNVDFVNDGDTDMILGEVIIRGSVYEDKLEDDVPSAFKDAAPMIRFVTE